MRLAPDNRTLERGVLTHSRLTSMQVDQTTSFDVEVTDVGKGPTGGSVSVAGVCSGGLTCVPRSSARQAFPGPGRPATWRWEVAARSPGEARILLVVTSYGRRPKIVLRTTSVVVRVEVQTTPLYLLRTYVGTHKRAIVFLGCGMLIVAGAAGAVLALLKRMGGASARAVSPGAGLPEADTEPLRVTLDRPAPVAASAGRPALGWKSLLWLPPIDLAAGGLAIWIVRSGTSAPFDLAVIGAAAVVVALPLYFLPVIIAYLRRAPDRASVAVIGIFLGWTYVGWVVALALAVRAGRPAVLVLPERGNVRPGKVTNGRPAVRDEPDVSRAGNNALL